MDSKTVIGFVLIFVVYFYFFVPKPGEQAPGSLQEASSKQEQVDATAANKNPVEKETTQRVNETLSDSKPSSDIRGKMITLENDHVALELNVLGEVEGVSFKNYIASADSTDPVSWDFKNVGGINRSFLRTSAGDPKWKLIRSDDSSILLKSNIKGIEFQRKIELQDDSYLLSVEDEILNRTDSSVRTDLDIELRHSMEGVEAPSLMSMFKPRDNIKEVAIYNEGSVWREPFSGLKGMENEFQVPILWAGYSYKYFFQGVVPQNVSIIKAETSPVDGNKILTKLSLSQKQITTNEKSSYKVFYYLGPKEMPELKKAGNELDKVIDYGDWIGPISRVLLQILHFFYSIIPNYGIAIVLLTLLVKMILFPLAYKSTVSMRKLSIVQPKMKNIRDKHKDDKQRMQAEMMALYRDEKVNPVGGCLPLLLQMPVFFALYRLFFASIELRQQPFFGWITDLSVHDPLFVTPVLMTVLMWGQQKITPTPPAGDNEAAKIQMSMMKWMPIMFGGIMLFLPAGLTLYFLVNSGMSILQQFFLNKRLDKTMPRPSAVAIAPKAG